MTRRFNFPDDGKKADEIWLLLWPVKQRCFHIETLAEFTESTRDMVFSDGEVTDYLPLCSGPSHHAMTVAASDDLRACLEAAANSKILKKGGDASKQ